ncbi:MAG: hypothetical protein ACI8W8_003586 [Rhodothermales bacterium]|jgi:hypothetical protein
MEALSYRIRFDDGDRTWMTLDELRLIASRVEPLRLPKIGDKVFGQWTPNNWYSGQVASTTEVGFRVEFEDGDTLDLPLELIAIDSMPAGEQVAVGSRILGHWEPGKFFPGTVMARK